MTNSRQMSAYAVAERLLGDMPLSVGQLTQLRAIDRKYQQRLFTLLHAAEGDGREPAAVRRFGSSVVRSARTPTDAEISELDEIAAADILDMHTPDQRRNIG
jgi:hypothetical protein